MRKKLDSRYFLFIVEITLLSAFELKGINDRTICTKHLHF